MTKLDLTVTIKCFSDDERVNKVTSDMLQEMLDDLKFNFVYEGIVHTSIEITENVTNQRLLFKTNTPEK